MQSPSEADRVSVRLVRIDASSAGQRIDNFLFVRLKGVPRSRVYRSLRQGEVRVNRARVSADYRLVDGDLVRVPPLRLGAREAPPVPGPRALASLREAVLYEDEALLAVNKPAMMAVHGGSGRSYGVIEALRHQRPQARFLELVHRLDRETSGCLLIAKKRALLIELHARLRSSHVTKRYLALLHGAWQGAPSVTVRAALRKSVLRSGERVVRPDPQGKAAWTQFRRLGVAHGLTLVEVRPGTGRTHQIRVHAQVLGHPIVGDAKYGGRLQVPAECGGHRLFLHCLEMRWRGSGGAPVSIVAPPPETFLRALERLGLASALP